ncbi:hypothetical protein Pla175_45340 [Pirellulimonas nuda]|uniref:Right handed beta helix domain-containing protein n=1 Tax=Pirellulimonas nuda TaxID=2528009 RepID=A0A518DI12_9BACT|nr:hypothetical protein Pla175_45340 [Pirellulimonas nuda]
MFRSTIVLLATCCTPAMAAQYFVDPAGSDANPGSAAQPWLTLQQAADQVGPGDRVTVRQGEYVGFHLNHGGAAGMPIEFVAEAGAVISTRNPTTPDGINLEGASHVVIDGFEVVGMPRAGVRTVGPFSGGAQSFAQHVAIRNVTSTDNGKWGILTGFVDDLLIENNRTSGSIDEHGIYVGNSGDRPVIRNNRVWGNRANGIHVNSDVNSGLDGVIEGAIISGNIIYDNGLGGGSGINMDGVINSRVENNLLYNNHASGVSLYQIDGALPSTGNVVANNTILQASDARWALNLQDGATNTTVANNILLSEHPFRGAIDASPDSLAGLSSDHNVVLDRFTTDGGDSVRTLAQWRTLTGGDSHSFVSTAADLFVDPAAGDYRLKAASPARDAGWNAQAPATDLRGALRDTGAAADIGAYEWLRIGDYNNDGAVDAADYTTWRDAVGQTGRLPNDDTGGAVGQGQYDAWKAQFGAASGATGGGVPEPAAWPLLLTACGATLGVRLHFAGRLVSVISSVGPSSSGGPSSIPGGSPRSTRPTHASNGRGAPSK